MKGLRPLKEMLDGEKVWFLIVGVNNKVEVAIFLACEVASCDGDE